MSVRESQQTAAAQPAAPTPSFVDLRAFAADVGRERIVGEAAADAFLSARRHLDLPPGPVSLGVIAPERSEGRVERLPGDEFLIVLAGELVIESGADRLALTADQSAILPAGIGFAWRAGPGTRLIFMRHIGDARADAAPLAINPAGLMEPSNPPLAELLVGPTPQCRNRTDYRSADGTFTTGVWDSTPYHRLAMPYRHYELMHLLAGAVSFEDGAGRRATFTAGDIFLIERGATCSWRSEVDVAKVFAIHRPFA